MANDILFHHAQKEAMALGDRLTAVISNIDHPDAVRLARRISTDIHDQPRLVFTGQYSSGKSTLISALTDGAAPVDIDSDITTDKVTEYDWDGLVALVDTPGVQAGVIRHDILAEEAIAAADLVLFTVTVDLFDDAGIQHLHHVTETLGKRDQFLLVITKANSMKAEPGVREAAVYAAIGASNGAVPVVECDARDYLDGLQHPDPTRADAYRHISRIDDLRDAINDISVQRGDLARYQQPFQVIKAVALEAESLVTDNPDEAAALALLARQRTALAARRQRIDAQLDDLASTFRTDSVRAAENFADAVESIESVPDGSARDQQVKTFTAELNDRLNLAAHRLGDDIRRVLEAQFNDLAAEVREIEASPHTRVVLALASETDFAASSSRITMTDHQGRAARFGGPVPPWANHAGRWLKEFEKSWGAGAGAKASAGSVGHEVVLNTGHLFGKRFKPWEAVRVANRIGKAAKIGSAVLSVAFELGALVAEENAEVKAQEERARRRRHLVAEVIRQAEEISRGATGAQRLHLDGVFAKAYAEIDSVHDEIVSARARRTSVSSELGAIRTTAQQAITLLVDDRGASSTPP